MIFHQLTFYIEMDTMKIFIRVRDKDDLEEVHLQALEQFENSSEGTLWESIGDYFLEGYQCGINPSICSIEKDIRIESTKEEIALLIMDEINKKSKAIAG